MRCADKILWKFAEILWTVLLLSLLLLLLLLI